MHSGWISQNRQNLFVRMLLSIPSKLDCLVATDPQENTQIEISIEEALFSILVTSNENFVQSVVAVPREEGSQRSRYRRNKQLSTIKGIFGGDKPSLPPPRRADELRPMSPVPSARRSSAFDDPTRRRGMSCPPSTIRNALNESKSSRPSRDYSCPPPRVRSNESHNQASSKTLSSSSSPPYNHSSKQSRKPNLVSMVASRKTNRFLGFRGGNKLTPGAIL